ncbi:methyltransferase [Parashewanella curva]|uniref:Methyltransferase n=1 Tax=Parashewanella curva TaxID=2338552 RepID=A0A3L8PZ28_9GAMM|nr:class I SAM-dependent methyltransferase [Parashewanella curva]RLV59843.1 methyltransferase [Parashewanella curva]
MKSQSTLALVILTGMLGLSGVSATAYGYDNHEQAKQGPTTLQYDYQYRTAKEKARDKYRHPKATLDFFGIKPTDTVIEIWPGGGWYSNILAPALKGSGEFIAAHFPSDSAVKYYRTSRAKYDVKFKDHPERYGLISVTSFMPPAHPVMAPAESADVVLTFRNVHNWIANDNEIEVFKAAYNALKPGGTFGVVEHRAKPDATRLEMIESGYVTEKFVKELAQKTGFKLVASSEVNANPKDTKNYPSGVWTLPPRLRLGDQNKAKYLAIGESDRMTLKFIKPK